MKHLFILSISVLVFSCNAFENENPEVLNLQGTWELQRFSGGFGGTTTILDSVDYTISLKVFGERADWILNDEIGMRYKIGRSSQSGFRLQLNPIEKNVQYLDIPRYIHRMEDRELLLTDACFDCYTYYFIRSEN